MLPNDSTILFWSVYDVNVDTSFEKWRARNIELSQLHRLSLLAHDKYNSNVFLFTYQTIAKSSLPESVTIMDAGDIYSPEKAYNALKIGHSIAHVSDAVRLLAAADCNGIVLDMDAVLLRKFPDCSGFFASMPAKRTGGFAPKWGKSHPPLYVSDGSWNGKALGAFPIKVNTAVSRSHINALASQIIYTLQRSPGTDSKAWNYVLWTIKKIMIIDRQSKVYQPISFCPLPGWLRAGKCYSIENPTRLDGKTQLFGYMLPTAEDILQKSYIVQHFFESAFQNAKPTEWDLWNTISDSCLLAKEARHVVGANWRIVLGSMITSASVGHTHTQCRHATARKRG